MEFYEELLIGVFLMLWDGVEELVDRWHDYAIFALLQSSDKVTLKLRKVALK